MEVLTITVIEARGLLGLDKGGTSDPYAAVSLADSTQNDITAAGKFKTKTVKKTTTPSWKEKFVFGKSFDIRNATFLQVKLMDYDFFGRDGQLGIVRIPLESITPNSMDNPLDMWYPLEKFDSMDTVSGEVHLSIVRRDPKDNTADPESGDAQGGEIGENPPNLLVVTVNQARGLRAMDRGGTSDPLVVLKCDGESFKTTKKAKTLNPTWNQKFKFPVVDSSKSLKVTVEDHDMTVNDFMGNVEIPLSQLIHGKETRQFYELLNKSFQREQTSRGEVELTLQWLFDANVKERMQKGGLFSNAFSSIAKTLNGDQSDEDEFSDNDGLEAEDEEPEKSEEELKKEKEEREKARKELEEELSTIEIKSGDYQVQVHVIEARELKPKDATGTSDPVVYVEVFGEKQNTEIKKKSLNCVWDDVLIFTFRNLDKEDVEMGTIKISVMDSNTVVRNEIIGAVQFDASYIYSQKDHELYRKWLALTNSEVKNNSGIQGYLKCSITVLGPGDKLKTHNLEKEMKAERDAEKGGGLSSMVIMPPSIEQDVSFLVTTVYYAEHLPPLDYNLIGKDGIDAFVSVLVGGNDKLKTKVRSKKGRRDQLNPQFNEELWSPIRIPSMTKNISLAVYDWDRVGDDDCVAHTYHNLKYIEKVKSVPPFWANLYGAPLKLITGENEKEVMNTFPDLATTYRGRLLVSFRIDENEDGKMEEISQKKRAKRIKPNLLPPTRMYQLRALVLSGSEIPKFMSIAHPGQSSKMQIVVSCGMHEILTERASNQNGVVEWNQYLQSDPLSLPEDPEQIPDIFVYLCKGKPSDRKVISYRRFKAKDLIEDCMKNPVGWLVMKEDPAQNALSDDKFPGNILIRLGFSTVEVANEAVSDWTAKVQEVRRRVPYQVRINMFQGRSLPAADSNGLLDPYVKVRFLGQEQKTQIKKKTRDPCWYETKIFDVELPPLEYAPQVCLRLFDWEANPLDPDDYCGTTFIDLSDAEQIENLESDEPHDPKWHSLMLQEKGDSEGELLVSVHLIRKKYPDEILPPPKSIVPRTRKAFLEITVLGLRDLDPFAFMPIQLPFIDFFLGSKDVAKHEMRTNRSKRPSGSNPNYLQRIVREVELPVNAMFAPRLNLVVQDTRLGGFYQPTIGTCAIDMVNKLPWSDTYVPPQSDIAVVEYEEEPIVSNADSQEEETKEEQEPLLSSLSTMRKTEADINLDPDVDTGAGVFGALKSMGIDATPDIESDLIALEEEINGEEQEVSGNVPPENEIPKYMIDRETLEEELEATLKTKPFESYALYLGQKFGGIKLKFGATENKMGSFRKTGKFKGLVRVMLNKDDPPLFDMKQLLSPHAYQVRVYVLSGIGFQPMDAGIGGRPGKSDPYLKLSLGKEKISDRKNYIDNTTDPDFYRLFEFKASLPGESTLTIGAYDYDLIGKDDLIGLTKIDLEDRLFDSRWQGLGEKYETDIRYRPRHIEKRSLYVPTSACPMGTIDLWIDILTPAEASAYVPVDVSLPPPREFELRVIIWKTKEVVSMDTITDMNDLYARCWVEGSDPQDTDIHWRAKKGKGSFNWRMKFPIILGHKQMNTKFPYLHLQLWDKDIFSFSDAIAEGMVDLGIQFRKAYKTNESVKVFENNKKKPVKTSKKASENEDAIRSIKEVTGLWDVDPSDSEWIKLERLNHDTQVREPMGEVNVSMEIVPKDKSDMMPVGYGRSSPNSNPYLPPPNGRLKFSMNPFYVFNELLGPKICGRVLCCLCCILFFVALYMFGPFINLWIAAVK